MSALDRRLADRVCVVTGAARGIGAAIATRFAAEGARIAALDVSARRLDPTVGALVAGGAEVRGYAIDVGRRADVHDGFARIEADFGAPVTVLVNNAVWARFQSLAEIDEATVEQMFDVGLKALIWALQAAVPQMRRAGGGSVVNLSSVSAVQSVTSSVAYAALKAGVLGLTRAAAVELSADRIRVNAILPGMIGTPASIAQFDDATIAVRRGRIPLGRFGEPEEIAAACAFLASDDAAYVQGASLVADGGWTVAAT
jgi:3-oxoacyl-[acyl-carrier protein] reductase